MTTISCDMIISKEHMLIAAYTYDFISQELCQAE